MFKEPRSSFPDYFISPKIYVKKSSTHGVGVFAKKDIGAHELIESSPILIYHDETFSDLYDMGDGTRHVIMDYPFEWNRRKNTSCLAWGYASLYNHSTHKSNVVWRCNEELESIEFLTKRPIKEGEELLSRYIHKEYSRHLWFVDDDTEYGHVHSRFRTGDLVSMTELEYKKGVNHEEAKLAKSVEKAFTSD